MGRRFLILDTTTYRKDLAYLPGHGYGRNVGTAQYPRWVADRLDAPGEVVIHATHGKTGTRSENEARYLRDSPDVSAHDLIGRDGTLYLILPDTMQAWHAGAVIDPRWSNARSIGIELHASTTEPITAAQKDTLAWRLLDIRTRHHIGAPDVRSHRAVATPRGRKSDPATWPDAELNVWVATLFATTLQPDPLPLYSEHSPILAPATGTLDAYRAAWLARCGGGPHYADAAIREIAGGYWTLCSAVGVDPWLAAAQCCHETGNLRSWWCARPRRNPAGLGVTGETRPDTQPDPGPGWALDAPAHVYRKGLRFSGWLAQSIPCHVGRLLRYALPASARLAPEQAPVVAQAMAARGLPVAYFGTAPILSGLDGRWASPGVGYGGRIAAVANVLRST